MSPEAVNVTPDGAEVWAGSNATGRVSVVDPKTGTVTTAAEGFGWPYRILFTPDVKTVLMPDLRREIGVKEVKGAVFLADRHSLLLVMLVFALSGYWGAGIVVLLAYSAASFFWAQDQAHRRQD